MVSVYNFSSSFQGRNFASLIQNYVKTYNPLNEVYLPLYETEAGRKVYEETLACVVEQFPQYVKEIQGTADGANVPFHKVRRIESCGSDSNQLSYVEIEFKIWKTDPRQFSLLDSFPYLGPDSFPRLKFQFLHELSGKIQGY